MSDNNSQREGDTDEIDDRNQPTTVASSPGSQSNSSSGLNSRDRVVELLPEAASNNNDNLPAAWVISADFYNEDVAQNSDADDTDNEDPNYELPDNNSENQNESEEDEEEDDEDMEDEINELEGYVIAPASREQDSSDTDMEEGNGQEGEDNYDITLPVGHHYLGDDLEESRGRSIFVENSLVELPLINLRHIVLLPGQTLPINTEYLNPQIHRYLKSCITRGFMTLGFMTEPADNPIGTTAEIRNHSLADDDKLKVIVVGRQRFKLLSPAFETATSGRVEILPEIELGLPYSKIPYLQRFYANTTLHRKLTVSKHPRWLLQRHEARNLVKRITNQIKDWYNRDIIEDYNDFSYWVASNLPISNHERMKALTFLCTEARLIWCMEMLERSDYFGCSGCKNVICHKKNVFPMSSIGPQCSFVNPSGYIHDILTVRSESSMGLIQEFGWSKEYSWFPGYEWRFAHCDNCNRHIGWCYKSINPNIKPRRFFGLSRANIRLQSNVIPAENLEDIEFQL